jgi:hypothetical protein
MTAFRERCLSAAAELGITSREAFAQDMESLLAEVVAFIRSGRGDAYEAVRHVACKRGVSVPSDT